MAAAYAYADGGPMPAEIRLLHAIDRFGAQAVFGRALGAKEIRHMIISENIINCFLSRAKSNDWATWELEHENEAVLLNAAMKAAMDEGLLDG